MPMGYLIFSTFMCFLLDRLCGTEYIPGQGWKTITWQTLKKDDPAFLYFPTNYRWSMGLLICLSGAPWIGVEIDEVNRVGRALAGKVGDDTAWFEEWTRMGDKIEARGRDALARRPQAHRGVMLYARLRATTRPASGSSTRARSAAWTSTRSR